jgi:hypothetical protein
MKLATRQRIAGLHEKATRIAALTKYPDGLDVLDASEIEDVVSEMYDEIQRFERDIEQEREEDAG